MYNKLPDGTYELDNSSIYTKENLEQFIDNEKKDIANWQKNITDAQARKKELEDLLK